MSRQTAKGEARRHCDPGNSQLQFPFVLTVDEREVEFPSELIERGDLQQSFFETEMVGSFDCRFLLSSARAALSSTPMKKNIFLYENAYNIWSCINL